VVPKFEENAPADLVEAFGKNLTRMGGRLVTDHADDMRSIRGLLEHSRLVCSAAPEIEGELDLAAVADPRALADVDHAVVRACCGVAETGSVLLTDVDLKVNALAYLAQHLIVLLDPADIVANIHSAYGRPEFRERHYAVFHSGPSATADIEGVLILGAQGVRSLSVLLWPRNPIEVDQAQGGSPTNE
jgi:L-lactate dehydrogenase complex protein LldG